MSGTPRREDRPHAEPSGPPRATCTAITWRAVVVGATLIPFTAWWLAEIEWVRYSDNATTSALFFNAVAVLLLLLAYNAAALTLCFAGLVRPVVAAILMPLSSIAIVTITAYRLSGRRLGKWMY